MDYSPPDSSVHGKFQARILEWVAIYYSNLATLTTTVTPGKSKIILLSQGRLKYGKVDLEGIILRLNLIFHLLIPGGLISPNTLSIFSSK